MKGIVFSVFNSLVEEKFGLECWDNILNKTNFESDGVYTSVDTYPDMEFIGLVIALSEETKTAVPDLIRSFGQYAFERLIQLNPKFVEGMSIKEFLLSVNDVVHVEVKKLYPEAILPDFLYEDVTENQLVMKYYSTRDLPQFAEGLILGAGEYFKTIVEVSYELVEDSKRHYRFLLKLG